MTTENFGRPNAMLTVGGVRPYEKLPLQGVSTTTTTYDFDSIVKKIERDDERQVGEMGVERNEKDRETEMKTDRNRETDAEIQLVIQGSHMVSGTRCPALSDRVK